MQRVPTIALLALLLPASLEAQTTDTEREAAGPVLQEEHRTMASLFDRYLEGLRSAYADEIGPAAGARR